MPNVEKAARHEQAVAHCRAWADIEAAHEARQGPLVEAAERALEEVARARVRDVLMQFEEGEPVRYSLFAVLDNADDEDDVRAWLAQVAQAIPVDLGVADQIEAASADGITFSTIDSSYSADVSQVTWRRDLPGPEGAT